MGSYPEWRGRPVTEDELGIIGPILTEDTPLVGPAILHGQRRGTPAQIPVEVIDREDMAQSRAVATPPVSYVLIRLPNPLALLMFNADRIVAVGRG